MKLKLQIDGRDHELELPPGAADNGVLHDVFDGNAFEADVAAIRRGTYSVLIGGRRYDVRVAPSEASTDSGNEYAVQVNGERLAVAVRDPRRKSRSARQGLARDGDRNIVALMPGKVVRLLVAEGEEVGEGQGMIVIEAMKMQNEIKSRNRGVVQKILVREGQTVNAGEVLLVVQ